MYPIHYPRLEQPPTSRCLLPDPRLLTAHVNRTFYFHCAIFSFGIYKPNLLFYFSGWAYMTSTPIFESTPAGATTWSSGRGRGAKTSSTTGETE